MTDLLAWADERPRVYRDTSKDAWESFLPVSAELDRAIMRELDSAGADGLICEQIETQLNRKHSAVSGNLRHLVENGFVHPTKLRGLTSSNRKAIKWVASRWFDPEKHGVEE